MDSNDNKSKKNEPRKVIDLTERIEARKLSNGPLEKLKAMKVRLDLEQAKIAIPASLLSIVVIVTLANSKLLTAPETVQSRDLASVGQTIAPSRGIASIPSGTTQSEDELVKTMAGKTLGEIAAVGRKPSALEKLSLETLEGKYAIRMDEAQKISEIEISASQIANPVSFDSKFIESNRSWMPVSFDKSIRVGNTESDSGSRQTYHLVNSLSMPVARIDVSLDTEGRLLAMKVVPTIASDSK
jgi:hypothetical protein